MIRDKINLQAAILLALFKGTLVKNNIAQTEEERIRVLFMIVITKAECNRAKRTLVNQGAGPDKMPACKFLSVNGCKGGSALYFLERLHNITFQPEINIPYNCKQAPEAYSCII